MRQIRNCLTPYSSPYWCSVPNIKKLGCVVPEKNVTDIILWRRRQTMDSDPYMSSLRNTGDTKKHFFVDFLKSLSHLYLYLTFSDSKDCFSKSLCRSSAFNRDSFSSCSAILCCNPDFVPCNCIQSFLVRDRSSRKSDATSCTCINWFSNTTYN